MGQEGFGVSYFVALRFQFLFIHISLRLSRGRAFTESSSCVWHVAKFLNMYDQQAFILFKLDNNPLREVLRNLILRGVGGLFILFFQVKRELGICLAKSGKTVAEQELGRGSG